MADAIGLSSKAAFRKDPGENATSPTGLKSYPHTPGGTDLGANDMIPFTNESLSEINEYSMDPALDGSHSAPPGEIILTNCSGTIGGHLRYCGWERPFLCAMGFEYSHSTNGSPKSLGSGAYAHLFEMDDLLQDLAYTAGERETYHANDIKARRGQIGLAKQVEDWVFSSCIFNSFKITGNPREITTEFGVIPYSLVRGSYNSGSWTAASGTATEALFKQCEIKLARRADTPGSMTTIAASGFEITGDGGMKGDDVTSESAPNIIIPVRENPFDVQLKIERPRFATAYDDQLITYIQGDTEFSAIITITGALIGGAYSYKYKLCFPSLKATSPIAVNIDGPGPLSHEWTFRAFRPLTTDPFAATEYESISLIKDSPFVMMIYNNENVNYLTEL